MRRGRKRTLYLLGWTFRLVRFRTAEYDKLPSARDAAAVCFTPHPGHSSRTAIIQRRMPARRQIKGVKVPTDSSSVSRH